MSYNPRGRKTVKTITYNKGMSAVARNRMALRRSALGLNRVVRGASKGYIRTSGFYGRYTGATPELKFFDTAISFTVDATAEVPASGQLSLIPQGVTQSTRVGRKAVVKSIRVHGVAILEPAAAAVSNAAIWIYVIQDTQCNGAAATVSGDTGVFTSASLQQANMNLSNGQRFKILHKFACTLTPQSGATTALNNVSKQLDWYGKVNIPLEFDAAADTGVITTIRSNNIFLVAGSYGAGGDDTVTFSGTCRLRFAD